MCLLIVSDVIDKFPTAERIRIVLFRNESRSLGFSVIIDVRKSTTKRKYLENIVEAMVCFQVCKRIKTLSCLLLSKEHYQTTVFSVTVNVFLS